MTTSNKSEIPPEMIVLKDMTFFYQDVFIKTKITCDYLTVSESEIELELY